ncbi:MAG: hypothetical protein KF857_08300 [Fimbriimonadaceae bacterium]|nr:hypothetical protein [Fimbriimonadaceae bacterium]
MARPGGDERFSGLSDTITGFFDNVARFLTWAGGLASVVGVGFLIFTYTQAGAGANAAQVAQNVQLFGQAALIGVIAVSIGVGWLMWGEETVGLILLIIGLALVFSPSYLPGMLGAQPSEQGSKAMEALAGAGYPAAIIGFLLIVGHIAMVVRTRASQGSRADQMKYGQGIKEESDVRNVILGKCWQLPYCRKFVRERCPIYHSKRTCWKERVGCMCEESVIRNAMEGKVIPADVVAASKFIPQNHKLTAQQKFERCKQCIIYNEHQKHKYKLALPMATVGVAVVYVFSRGPAGEFIKTKLVSVEAATKKATFANDQNQQPAVDPKTGRPQAKLVSEDVTSIKSGFIPYHEILYFVFVLVLLAYLVKFIEYLFFKLKV